MTADWAQMKTKPQEGSASAPATKISMSDHCQDHDKFHVGCLECDRERNNHLLSVVIGDGSKTEFSDIINEELAKIMTTEAKEFRLRAHELIRRLYTAGELSQLKLLKAHCDSAIVELLLKELGPLAGKAENKAGCPVRIKNDGVPEPPQQTEAGKPCPCSKPTPI